MIKVESYWKFMRITATVGLFLQNMHYAITQPGPMDSFNALVSALCIYAIWFARERTKK